MMKTNQFHSSCVCIMQSVVEHHLIIGIQFNEWCAFIIGDYGWIMKKNKQTNFHEISNKQTLLIVLTESQ